MHKIKIVTETEFGQGDSSTKIYAECINCKKSTPLIWQCGFPATYANIRLAQSDFEKLDTDCIDSRVTIP